MAIENYSGREINIRELYTGEARCEEINFNLFFPEKFEGSGVVRKVKKVCSTCSLLDKCRDYGLQNQVHGIWGGLTSLERRKIRSKLGIIPKEIVEDAA